MLEILGKTNIDFMGKRRYAFLFSGIMVVLGIIGIDSDRSRGPPIWASTLRAARPCS